MNLQDIVEDELYLYSPYGKKPRKVRCVSHVGLYASVVVEDEESPSNGVQMNIYDSDAESFITEIKKDDEQGDKV